MTEATQNLTQTIREQTLKSAQDFYGNSLGSLKGQLHSDRSQLEELLQQLPHSQEDARARIQELVDSYEAIGSSLNELAQEQGVEDAVSQAAQRVQEETAGQASHQVLEAAGQAIEQAQEGGESIAKSSRRDKVKGATTSAAGRALGAVGSLTGNRRIKAKGFLARQKGAFDKKKGELKGLLKK